MRLLDNSRYKSEAVTLPYVDHPMVYIVSFVIDTKRISIHLLRKTEMVKKLGVECRASNELFDHVHKKSICFAKVVVAVCANSSFFLPGTSIALL